MEIRSDIYTRLDAFDPSAATPTEMTSECVSRNETVNSTLYQVLTIVTDVLSRKQISPANLTTHNCFVKNSTIDSVGKGVFTPTHGLVLDTTSSCLFPHYSKED